MKKYKIGFIILMCLSLSLGGFLHFGGGVIKADALGGECMITVEASTGRILYGHNYNKKRPMASVTKILTAITVIENYTESGRNLNAKIKVPAAAVGIEGSSIYLAAGEEISTLDLLYGLMLQSGNDCAVALAIVTSGSVESFSALMNKTALKAGAKNSNFTNPHGLHQDKHYTTAYDLAMITVYAMRNPVFKEIAATKRREIERTRKESVHVIINKNKLLSTFDGGDGVKTGFTKKAGRCLVASATRDGMQVIAVVLNCGPMFEDCAALMSRAFNEYRLEKIASAFQPLAEVKISNSRRTTVQTGVIKDVYYPLAAGEKEKIETAAKPSSTLAAPVRKGKPAGIVEFRLNKQLLLSEKLYTIEDAPALKIDDYLRKLLLDW